MKIEVPAAQTKGASSVMRVQVPPGVGPPAAHIHSREDETYIITRGHFRFWHGKQVVDAMPGSVVFLPRNEAHQWLNVGSTPGEHIMVISPAGLERFFLEVSKRGLTMPKDQAEFMRISAAYGIRYVASLMKHPMRR
jgi:quercetin dioxygenase-like cupin family protein